METKILQGPLSPIFVVTVEIHVISEYNANMWYQRKLCQQYVWKYEFGPIDVKTSAFYIQIKIIVIYIENDFLGSHEIIVEWLI